MNARRHDLATFDLSDMIECGRAVRSAAETSSSMESAAGHIVRWFYNNLVDEITGDRNCALVRCFKTHRLGELPPDLTSRVRAVLPPDRAVESEMPVLTLLATAGDLPAWNDRRGSSAHAAIPLESVNFVERAPMIASLIRQMGLEIQDAMYPTAKLVIDSEQHAFNVFHVADAQGDPCIPAQETFVRPERIRSVLGFGGLLPSGELFAVIMFSRTAIPRETADLFRTIALGVKLALLPYTRIPSFEPLPGQPALAPLPTRAGGRPAPGIPFGHTEEEQLRSEIATLQLLIPALEDAALHQTQRLQAAFADLELREKDVRTHGLRLGAMLEATSDAVFVLDRQWRFTFLNRHAREILAPGRKLLNTTLSEAFPAASSTAFVTQYTRVMNERITVQFLEFYPEPLNKWFEVHASPSEDGIVVFFRDVTERLRTEASLRQAEKLAATGRMAASIAHEINNPLEAVTNLLYLLATDESMGPDSKTFVHEAESELRRVSEITTHMLRFYRQSTNPTEVNLCEVVESVLVLFQGRLSRAGIVVEKRYDAPRNLRGFAGELRQIIANLVGNALDASPEGGTLKLRIRNAKDPVSHNAGVRITVADTGMGMSATTQRKLFEPFFTTKGSTGTGLGLWVSLELIQKHHGTVRVRSNEFGPRHGTVFSLFLPLKGRDPVSDPMDLA